MKCNLTQEQMTLTDRIAIETGICHKDSFRKIALFLHRHPTTISHEVKENRTFLPGRYFLGKDCYFVRKCKEQHVCGDGDCIMSCCRCRVVDCRTKCARYRSTACHRFEKPPIDLQRKNSYKPRKKKCEPKLGFQNQEFRKSRTYDDFEKVMKVSLLR